MQLFILSFISLECEGSFLESKLEKRREECTIQEGGAQDLRGEGRGGEGWTENDCARDFRTVTEGSHEVSGLTHLAPLRLIELVISNWGERGTLVRSSRAFQELGASDYLSETLQASGDSHQRNGLCKGRQLSWES